MMNRTQTTKSDPASRTRTSFIRGLKAHDEASWWEFYEKYRGRIYGRAVAKGLSWSEADDVVQETVGTILKEIDHFVYDRTKGRFIGLVLNTARWKIADKFREGRSAKTVEAAQCDETRKTEGIEQLSSNEASPSQVLEQKEMQEMAKTLSDAVMARIKARSNPKQYQIYDLYVVKDWTVERVCRALGVREQDVYLAAHRISRKIQKEVEKLKKAFEQDQSNRKSTLIRSLPKEESTRETIKTNPDQHHHVGSSGNQSSDMA